jgi:hypothetical protein
MCVLAMCVVYIMYWPMNHLHAECLTVLNASLMMIDAT